MGDHVDEVVNDEDLAVLEVVVDILSAKDLVAGDSTGTSDPYVKGSIKELSGKPSKLYKFRSSTVKKTVNPEWDEYVHKRTWELKLTPGQSCVIQVIPSTVPFTLFLLRAFFFFFDLSFYKRKVFDEDTMGQDENLGSATLEYTEINKIVSKQGGEAQKTLNLKEKHGKPAQGTLTIKIKARAVLVAQVLFAILCTLFLSFLGFFQRGNSY